MPGIPPSSLPPCQEVVVNLDAILHFNGFLAGGIFRHDTRYDMYSYSSCEHERPQDRREGAGEEEEEEERV